MSRRASFDAMMQVKEQIPDSPEIQEIIRFVEGSKLGVIQQQV
jgi:hypothetical protein